MIGSTLKMRIFGRVQGQTENENEGILDYVEDLRRGLNEGTFQPLEDLSA
jgi:hypothetical protein